MKAVVPCFRLDPDVIDQNQDTVQQGGKGSRDVRRNFTRKGSMAGSHVHSRIFETDVCPPLPCPYPQTRRGSGGAVRIWWCRKDAHKYIVAPPQDETPSLRAPPPVHCNSPLCSLCRIAFLLAVLHAERHMEVRWRLFARDVLSLLADDGGEFRFGRPPRPVRGLRLLGVVVHQERGGTSATEASSRRRAEEARAGGVMGNGKKRGRVTGGGEDSSGDGSLVDREFGLLGIGGSICALCLCISMSCSARRGAGGHAAMVVGQRVFRTAHTEAYYCGRAAEETHTTLLW